MANLEACARSMSASNSLILLLEVQYPSIFQALLMEIIRLTPIFEALTAFGLAHWKEREGTCATSSTYSKKISLNRGQFDRETCVASLPARVRFCLCFARVFLKEERGGRQREREAFCLRRSMRLTSIQPFYTETPHEKHLPLIL